MSSDSDFGDSSSDDEFGGRAHSCALLCGPSGCGKTAMVYACAQAAGFAVVEVNASTKRTKELMESVSGASSNHRIQFHDDSPFTRRRESAAVPRKRRIVMDMLPTESSEAEDVSASAAAAAKESIRSDSVLLLDDADLIFDESDAPFITAVNRLILTSQCPVIITCTRSFSSAMFVAMS